MIENVEFTPGNHETTGSWSSDSIINVDGRLATDDGLIVDTDGNRILIGGGFDDGEEETPVTWTPGVL